jgi:hypothetical protein
MQQNAAAATTKITNRIQFIFGPSIWIMGDQFVGARIFTQTIAIRGSLLWSEVCPVAYSGSLIFTGFL